jgi:DNA-3-methyladenine glycosylase II
VHPGTPPPRQLTRATLRAGVQTLAARDADLAAIVRRLGPPPLWARRPGFPTLIRIVLEQQVSLAPARAQLDLQAIARTADAAGRQALLEVRGLGPWSVDIYYLMALRRPDVWPQGDLALADAVFRVKRLPSRPAPSVLSRLAVQWAPWRSVAARILWHFYLSIPEPRSGRPGDTPN